jgi:hypothetical protein
MLCKALYQARASVGAQQKLPLVCYSDVRHVLLLLGI